MVEKDKQPVIQAVSLDLETEDNIVVGKNTPDPQLRAAMRKLEDRYGEDCFVVGMRLGLLG